MGSTMSPLSHSHTLHFSSYVMYICLHCILMIYKSLWRVATTRAYPHGEDYEQSSIPCSDMHVFTFALKFVAPLTKCWAHNSLRTKQSMSVINERWTKDDIIEVAILKSTRTDLNLPCPTNNKDQGSIPTQLLFRLLCPLANTSIPMQITLGHNHITKTYKFVYEYHVL